MDISIRCREVGRKLDEMLGPTFIRAGFESRPGDEVTQSPETRRDNLDAQVGIQGHDAPVPCRRSIVWRKLRTTGVMLFRHIPL
jgi:hypothetical protein